jgi:hypothetical protein
MNLLPAVLRGRGGQFRDVATFDVQMNDGLRLCGLRLVEAPGGRRLVYAPAKGGRRFATFSADYAREISAAATAVLMGGYEANGLQ